MYFEHKRRLLAGILLSAALLRGAEAPEPMSPLQWEAALLRFPPRRTGGAVPLGEARQMDPRTWKRPGAARLRPMTSPSPRRSGRRWTTVILRTPPL